MSKRNSAVISLFSGALGLDLGLEKAGFRIRVAVESNKYAAETIRLNRPHVEVIERRIEKVETKEILERAGLKVGETAVVSAGPACQAFSTAGSRKSMKDPRGAMFREFLRIVRGAKPRFFVMENVPGMLSAAVRHRPLKERGHGYPPLRPDEEFGSAFALILKELKKTGYYIVFDVLNAADYGVPQCRERIVFIGSRDGEPIAIPQASHSSEGIRGQKKSWVTLRAAVRNLNEEKPEFVALTPSYKKYMKKVPPGGNWRSIPGLFRWRAMGDAYKSWGGRMGFFRRLNWDRPAPSLTTHPVSKATMLCHPRKLRPLTVKEYAVVQQFPKRWKFAGGILQKYMQIGNAVPVGLGKAIGLAIKKTIRNGNAKGKRLRGIVCKNEILVSRISKRPRTMVNPPRMRKVKSAKLTKQWLNHRKRRKHIFLKYISASSQVHVKMRKVREGRSIASAKRSQES